MISPCHFFTSTDSIFCDTLLFLPRCLYLCMISQHPSLISQHLNLSVSNSSDLLYHSSYIIHPQFTLTQMPFRQSVHPLQSSTARHFPVVCQASIPRRGLLLLLLTGGIFPRNIGPSKSRKIRGFIRLAILISLDLLGAASRKQIVDIVVGRCDATFN